jgi:hypothetical protein
MADKQGDLDAGASWHIDDVPPQQDRIPPQFDRVPQPPPEPRPQPEGSLRRRIRSSAKFGAVVALLLVTLTLGLVEPLRMWNHGWNTAQHLRGAGADRGVFTVSACGASHQDSDDNTYWDCTGTFTQLGADPFQTDVYDEHDDHAGVTRKAYSESDGSIALAAYDKAGAMLGVWATLALGVFLAEIVVWFCLAGWILYDNDLGEAASLAAGMVAIGAVGLVIIGLLVIATLAITFAVVQG